MPHSQCWMIPFFVTDLSTDIPWSKNDKLFQKEAREGHEYQYQVSDKLTSEGWEVHVPDFEFRESIKDAHLYKDQADIYLHTDKKGKLLLEVKSRRLRFTRPEDYPYETVMVDTVSSWEGKTNKPHFYLILSRETGEVLVIPHSTKENWRTVRKWDHVRKIKDNWYVCPKEKCLTWAQFVRGVKKHCY